MILDSSVFGSEPGRHTTRLWRGRLRRSGKERLEAILPAIEARDAFLERVNLACTRTECADLMAEAIGMLIAANGMEHVGRDGRARICVEEIAAAHCLVAARKAYAAHVNTLTTDGTND